MDWKYALSLELTDPGFDFTLLHDFRCRLLAHAAGQRFLDTFLAACKARGWIKTRGTQRTDSTEVVVGVSSRSNPSDTVSIAVQHLRYLHRSVLVLQKSRIAVATTAYGSASLKLLG
jgi:hypothetical protein